MNDTQRLLEVGNLPGRAVNVVDGRRTPFLRARGEPGPFGAADLAVAAGRSLLTATAVPAESLDQVILGCVAPAADEANIARVVALRLGCRHGLPAWTVQRNCASGLQAVDSAALEIATGRADLVLAGGTEAMSRYPLVLGGLLLHWLAGWRRAGSLRARGRALMQLRPGHFRPVAALLQGLTDPVTGLSMGQTAEELAQRFAIERTDMDLFAERSHRRLARAYAEDRLDEIEPLYAGDGQVYERDEGLREETSLDALARLKPAFDRPVGQITAGNSAQITDGAALLLLASDQMVGRLGLPPLGRVVDSQWAGLDPVMMGLGPVHAMAPIMQRHGLDSHDIGAWEINEAFAAQVLACQKAWSDDDYCRSRLGLDRGFAPINEDLLNTDGGAISLGHPVGASGARIVLHALRVMQRTGSRRGMASLCIGGGQGGAILLECQNDREAAA